MKRIVQHVVWYVQEQWTGLCNLYLHIKDAADFTTICVNCFTCIVFAG